MHYTGPVYRHPLEINTPLLEITYGCSWNKCSFCNMYKEVQFNVSPMEHIREDLEEMSEKYPKSLKNIVLVNGDPFALPTEKLLEISDLIHEYFPDVRRLSMQASIRNIKTKTVDQLKELSNAKYNDLYIGLETAHPETLKLMNKGFTQQDQYHELAKIQEADIKYIALLMLGVAGEGNSDISTTETAKLLNKYQPRMVSVITTAIAPDTPLMKMKEDGKFIQLTEKEVIEEEIMLVEKLDLNPNCYFFGSHLNNLAPVNDHFKYKDRLIQKLKDRLEYLEENRRDELYSKLNRYQV